MTIPEWIKDIKEREEKATKGPWVYDGDYAVECPDCDGEPYVCDITAEHENSTPYLSLALQFYGLKELVVPNAEFVSKARQDIPNLLTAYLKAREALELSLTGEYQSCDGSFCTGCWKDLAREALNFDPTKEVI